MLLDLYSGTGALALGLAGHARMVFGAEESPGAVHDARANAARNGISNAHFLRADLSTQEGVAAVARRVPHPDTVIAGAPHHILLCTMADAASMLLTGGLLGAFSKWVCMSLLLQACVLGVGPVTEDHISLSI